MHWLAAFPDGFGPICQLKPRGGIAYILRCCSTDGLIRGWRGLSFSKFESGSCSAACYPCLSSIFKGWWYSFVVSYFWMAVLQLLRLSLSWPKLWWGSIFRSGCKGHMAIMTHHLQILLIFPITIITWSRKAGKWANRIPISCFYVLFSKY